ncbi:hypothetical protein SAMD00019534_084190 [Acytostelium subglobosum LB1]|uniref:hypothetical protein n=1 Tax=Acytostelium subglobosum LB1 TaxID=1410327 RepID=UPI000644EA78|nr:hypothetical protein SAMD00019534_084190 [Acytostelium subglobosum LB1]GAM25244.1 hypothetical protein SAMD00019534_084190 [Acytostelium subglobosum LB1]|eukprot:XP_012751764.1 hypothetical protein SAMD00019534_084190 [Acytostelium subglobosum LB1]
MYKGLNEEEEVMMTSLAESSDDGKGQPQKGGPGGFGSNTEHIEPELNTRIKRRFEEAVHYFTEVVESLMLSGATSDRDDSIQKYFYTNDNNNGVADINASTNIEGQGAMFGPDRSENSGTDNSQRQFLPKNKINHNYNKDNSNSGKDNNNNNSGTEEDSDEDLDTDSDTNPFLLGATTSNIANKSSEDENLRVAVLSKPENQELLQSYVKKLWKMNYRYREQLYFSLSSVHDSSLVDQLIATSFNSFVDNCFQELFDRFDNQYHQHIGLLKLMRKSPEQPMDSKPNERYRPVFKQAKESPMDLFSIIKQQAINAKNSHTLTEIVLSLIPVMVWVRKYKLHYLKDDVIAALTIGFMLIPQAMAYAILAGLPPIYGLYSAFVSPIVYGIFGTSNEIQVGPVAMVSLLIPTIVHHARGSDEYIVEASCLALMTGLIMLVMGLFRVGFLIETLLSNPILLGFVQAGSVLIMLSQIKNFTAITIPANAANIIEYGEGIVHYAHTINGWTVLMGSVSLAILIGSKYVNKRLRYKIPTPIIILILGTLISYLANVEGRLGIKVVNAIPSGLPRPRLVPLTLERISSMIVGASIIAILGFVETVSVGKKFCAYRKYQINSSQELVALGMCNIMGSVFTGFNTTGSFSRSAVAFQTQSKSPLTSILSGLIVMVVLLLLTQVFRYTPLCILSAIVIGAAITLIEVHETIELYRKGEYIGFFQLLIVFVLTLLLGSETGIIIAFVISILQIIFFSSRPNLVILGRIPGTLVFRSIKHYPNALVYPGIMIIRFDSRMTYYTINHFRTKVVAIMSSTDDAAPINGRGPVHTIVIDAVNVSSMDSTALDVLSDMLDHFESNGILVLWSDLRPAIHRVMQRSGFTKRISKEHIFTSTSAAVDFAQSVKQYTYDSLDIVS